MDFEHRINLRISDDMYKKIQQITKSDTSIYENSSDFIRIGLFCYIQSILSEKIIKNGKIMESGG